MTTALITGGLGFIGSNLAKQLLKGKVVKKCILLDVFAGYVNPTKEGFQDYRKFRFSDLKNIEIIRGDAKDYRTVLNILLKSNPKYIFHTAAVPLAKIDNLNAKETKEGSIDTTVNILECVNEFQKKNKINLERFVYISSSMVYGDFKSKSVNENAKCNPKGIYGTLKYCSELMIKSYNEVFGLKYTIVRPSALYGERCISSRVGQIFLEKSIKNEAITINGDGTDKLDFTYIDDLMYGVYKIIITKKSLNQIFNITYGHSRKISEMLNLVRKNFKDVKVNYIKRDKLVPRRGTLSTAKAKKLIGYKSSFPLEKGFLNYIKWYKTKNKIFDI